MPDAQPGRSKRATATLTEYEKKALQVLALLRETDESTLLRDKTMAQIVAEYEAAKRAGEVAA